MKYSIIIPTYNHCDDLLRPCVRSILDYSHMHEVELVISANGCTDNTWSYLQGLQHEFASLGLQDHFKCVWHHEPLGFSRAVNRGIEVSQGDRVLLLNNDVILLPQPRHQWLQRLNAPFEQSDRVGITSTLKLYSPQTGRHFAVFFCTMINRPVIHRLGLLNEAFGVGAGEDTEYCFKAEQAGFEVVGVARTRYEPSINTNASDFPIWHKAEGTMHDPTLVPNWHDLFNANTVLLDRMFTPTCVAESTAELAQRFPEIGDVDAESQDLMQEIWCNNGYNITPQSMRNKEVIDIGANVGMFAIAAAALGASHVWAFEPTPHVYNQLCKNCEQVGVAHKVHVHAQAVLGQDSPPVSMSVNARHGSNSIYTHSDHTQLVPVTTLTHIMSQTFSHDVVLKLDCEGAEWSILLHTPDHVFDRIRTIHVEIHTRMVPEHTNAQVLRDRLTHLGFHSVSSKNIGIYYNDSQGNPTHWDGGIYFIETWSK